MRIFKPEEAELIKALNGNNIFSFLENLGFGISFDGNLMELIHIELNIVFSFEKGTTLSYDKLNDFLSFYYRCKTEQLK